MIVWSSTLFGARFSIDSSILENTLARRASIIRYVFFFFSFLFEILKYSLSLFLSLCLPPSHTNLTTFFPVNHSLPNERTNVRTHFGPRRASSLLLLLFFFSLYFKSDLPKYVRTVTFSCALHLRIYIYIYIICIYICIYIYIICIYYFAVGTLCFFFSLTNTIALYKTRIYKMIDLYSINRFPLFLPIFIIFLFFFFNVLVSSFLFHLFRLV